MNENEIVKVLDKLLGPIFPIGDSGKDSESLKNLETLGKVLQTYVGKITYLKDIYSCDQQNSVKESVKVAKKIINNIKNQLDV